MISQRVLCFVEREQRLLMLHRRRPPNARVWNGIGGKIEPGEDPYTACVREVFEETGLAIEAPVLKVLLVVTVQEPEQLWVIYVFRARAGPGDAVASEEGELRWVEADDLTDLRTPPDLPVILPRVLYGDDVSVVRLEYEKEDDAPRQIAVLGT